MDQPTTMVDVLQRHFDPTIEMLRQALEACPDDLWDARDTGAPLWQLAYHVLLGIDYWFRESSEGFAFPPFHTREAMLESGEVPDQALTRAQIEGYLEQVYARSHALLDRLTPKGLLREAAFPGGSWTVADRLLVQIRHVQHHVGQMNHLLKQKTGAAPGWQGYNE